MTTHTATDGADDAYLDDLEALYRNTGNPLHVWAAIAYAGRVHSVGGTRIPTWCAHYLFETAVRIGELHDHRRYNEAGEMLPPTKGNPVEKLPAALALVRPGWNAFAALRAWWSKEVDREILWDLRREGMTTEAALEVIRERRGLSDDRAVRRRVAEAVRALPLSEGKT